MSLNMPTERTSGESQESIAEAACSPAETYRTGWDAIRQDFDAKADGVAMLRRRSELVDKVVKQLYRDFISDDEAGPKNFCLMAVGGYGRRELFPYSDIDLVFLVENGRAAAAQREAISSVSRNLWDLRLRVGNSTRTLAECGQIQRDNLELSMSLLDARHLAGDTHLFSRLHDQVIPQLAARDRQDLVGDLLKMTRERHQKYGGTIFHLEPNIKEAPGGLRDYHVSRWLAIIAELDRQGRWTTAEDQWPLALRAPSQQAFEYLAAVRCFIHYRQARDDNNLSYELQDQAAALGIGVRSAEDKDLVQVLAAADWMRSYYRHVRTLDRLVTQLMDDVAGPRSSLYSLFQDWRSRLANQDFSVIRGRIFPRQPAVGVADAGLLLSLFEMVARHGLELSREAERWAEEALSWIGEHAVHYPELWQRLHRILVLPHAADALRAMHRLGLLVAVFPEFRAIDALVIRDFYHRYTVDEHSFLTIQRLHELPARPASASRTDSFGGPGQSGAPHDSGEGDWEKRLGAILGEVEKPELLYFALLFHDVGKGMPRPFHIQGSLEALESAFQRLDLDHEDRESIRFLILQHLEMSSTLQRRDIFDLETVRAFAAKVGTTERLKMLTLLTYADIKAVNPDALTPWKTEMLWRLYAATVNYFSRGVDEERFHELEASEAAREKVQRVLPLAKAAAFDVAPEASLRAFLEGLPTRYLQAHSPETITLHYRMARQLRQAPAQVQLTGHYGQYELTVLSADRPFLFASITGTLAAYGMNILKADGFSNAAGVALDTFRLVDLYNTLELNPSERTRFEKSLLDVLTGATTLGAVASRRVGAHRLPRPKVHIATQIFFDDTSSSHSTILELITQDRAGLLYMVSSALAEQGCNIEVALIDTEGEKVIDVFYLTSGGQKLDTREQSAVRAAIAAKLHTRDAIQA
jgi:[protein-PII] uridylyltransferase